ncbi:adipocyte plasma membrane-associated protein Hemomucin [Halictus rubicundus]|uniref:adipocyte plasma membrane-associated protein Hemomucin n=1 Tax=Halictus rubicundus TaxID=77578 RepID=UPI0040371B9C
MGYLKSIGTSIIYIGAFFALITFLPGLPPQVEFSEYRIKNPSETKLQFEIKNRLEGAEVLYAGELKGAESFASYNGELYTGIRGGYVVKIDGNNIAPVVKFGQKCDGLWQDEKCGRPLGLQFNDKGELFVADAYYGIFKVNVNTRKFVNIVNSSKPIDGKTPKIVNSIDIAKNGDIYWTDSSTDFPLHDGSYTLLANPSGRLIRYNAATKKNEVLVKNLGFANGLLLADDESFVIVLECSHSRIIKYHLKGPKTGQSEIFAEALPGILDNVHTDGQGGFMVSIITYVDSEYPMLSQSLIPHPYLRKMITRLLYLIEAPFKLLQDVYPNYYAERVISSVGSFESLKVIVDAKSMSVVLRMDKAGNVLDAIASDDGTVHDISSAYVHNGYLWFGSPFNEYIMRVPFKQAFPHLKESKQPAREKRHKEQEPLLTVSNTPNIKVDVKPSKAKVTAKETTPKPTVTTPKATATTQTPTTTTQKPTTTTQKPTTTTQKPTTTTQKPTTTTPKPTTTTTTPKPTTTTTTSKPTTTTPKPTPTTPKPTTQKIATEQKRPTTTANPPSSTPPPSKAPMNEVKKENSKEMKNENLKEVKKEPSTSNVNTKTTSAKTDSTEKNQEDKVKSKSDESAKKNTRESQPGQSKPVEKKSDSTKK